MKGRIAAGLRLGLRRLEAAVFVCQGLRGELHAGAGVLLSLLRRRRFHVPELFPPCRPVLRLDAKEKERTKAGTKKGTTQVQYKRAVQGVVGGECHRQRNGSVGTYDGVKRSIRQKRDAELDAGSPCEKGFWEGFGEIQDARHKQGRVCECVGSLGQACCTKQAADLVQFG